MHHCPWVGAVSNRAYWVVAIWRSQPTEGGKLFRMAARCIISDGEARFPTAPTGLLRWGERNLQKGENCSGWPRVHHCPWGGAVSNRAYRVVAMGRAQPTEGENCSGWQRVHHCPWVGAVSNRAYRVGVAMGRAQPTEWGKRIGSVKKFDLIKRVMVCYIRKTFTSLEKFGSTSLKGELSVGALSKRALTPFSSTSLKGERYAPCKNVRTFVDRYL